MRRLNVGRLLDAAEADAGTDDPSEVAKALARYQRQEEGEKGRIICRNAPGAAPSNIVEGDCFIAINQPVFSARVGAGPGGRSSLRPIAHAEITAEWTKRGMSAAQIADLLQDEDRQDDVRQVKRWRKLARDLGLL